MSDVNANIGVNFDTSQALAELKNLQRQLSQFHTSISRTSESAAIAQKNLQTNLLNSVNATGNFIAQMGVIKTSTESFTHALENNKLSMREYFRYAGGASQTFGKLFTNEFNTIGKVAEERVKRLQTQYIKMGRDTTGAMRAMAIMPATLDMNSLATRTQIAAQKQAIFNQLLKQGSTQLLNFGKNTQWAGRQLMVGFTVPLIAFGSAATRAFTDIESAAIKFKKVYGDLGTSQQETDAVLTEIRSIADAYTKYGVAVKDTIALSADAAAAGYKNKDLIAQTTSATKLSVLGQIDSQQALQTTISLQSAFRISADQLATTIDFLNSVENQTVLSLDDITTAIPKVAPIIQQLGGDVKDLAFFMTSMKEGGVNASEGANALKSGLASLINPSTKAKDMLSGLGINIMDIVQKDKGNLKKMVMDVAAALDTLEPLTRARAIEQMFGKFQFARMSTLFDNINKQGSQASRVLDLMGLSASELASISDKELGVQGASALTKFRAAIEKLKASIAPVGELFMNIFTPIIDSIGGLLDKFNHLSDGAKKAIGVIVAVIGGLGPVALMTFGLLANAFANAIKLFATLRAGYQRLTGQSQSLGEQTQYLTTEQIDAAAAAHSLDQSHAKLTQTFTAEAGAVNNLRSAYSRATVAAEAFRVANPGMMTMPTRKLASGGVIHGPGTGTSDSIPAMVSNGESIIPAKQTKKYGSLINGIIANNIPGFMSGRAAAYAHAQMPFAPGSAQYQQGIKIAGIEKLAAEFPQFIKVVSNLVAELPQAVNVSMKKGVDVAQFAGAYGERTGKFKTAASLGGLNISDAKQALALQELEDEIGQATIQLAKQTAAGKKVVVSDELFEKATRSVIDKYKNVEGATGKAAQALDTASQQIGQVRVSAKKEDIVAGLESGKFVRSRTGKQTQNQIMYGDFNIARESRSEPNQFQSGNPAYIRGSYKNKTKQAAMVATGNILDEVVDGVVQEAKIKRPSRKARAAGQILAATAITDSSSGGGIGGSGLPPIGGSGGGTDGGDSSPKKTAMNLSRMNGALMGATFGLTSLASVGSMAGGTIGELSGQVMKYSGLLFGLMSITQLLTQTSILELASKRANIAATAMGSAGGVKGLFSSGGGLIGFGKNLLTAGKFAMRFAGGIGLAIAAVTAAVSVFQFFKKKNQEATDKIEGLGNAATLSANKLKTLGDFFGVKPQTTRMERTGPSLILDKEKRTQVDELKGSAGFQKDFKTDIKSLKGATDNQAKIIFNSLAIQLKGKGFAKENIDTILKALQEESGKTNLKLDFAQIDLATQQGQKQLQKSANTLGNSFGKQFGKGYSSSVQYVMNRVTGETVAITNEKLSKGLQKNLSLTSKAFAGMMNGLSGQLENGSINAEQFNQSFETISKTITNMPNPQALLLMDNVIKNMPGPLAKSALGIKNVKDQMLIAKAAALGVATITPQMIEQLKVAATSTDGAASRAASRVRRYIEGEMKGIQQVIDMVTDAAGKAGGKEGGGEKSALTLASEAFAKQTLEITRNIAAYNKLKKAKFSDADASALAADSTIADLLALTKKGPAYDALIKKIGAYNKLLKEQGLLGQSSAQQQYDAIIKQADNAIDILNARAAVLEAQADAQKRIDQASIDSIQQKIDDNQKLIDGWQSSIDSNNHSIELLNHRMDLEIDRPLAKLNEESDILSNNLSQIDHQVSAINEQYDKQAAALELVNKANQDAIAQGKTRISIADALSSGDISAAAQAVQDLRAQQAQAQSGAMQNAMDASRANAISGVTAGGMTKDQIEKRQYEISQLSFALDQKRKDIQAQIQAIQDKNYTIEQNIYANKVAVVDVNTKLLKDAQDTLDKNQKSYEVQIETLNVDGKTIKAWENIKINADLAYKTFLNVQATTEASRNAALVLKSTFESLAKNPPRFSSYETHYITNVVTTISAPSTVQKKANGGLIEYFAGGGAARGFDTVPAMLTPGEFVVNKTASKAFRPLLESMNKATYPNMSRIGSDSAASTTAHLSNVVTDNSQTAYNYSLSVNMNGSNANPNDVANAVLVKIRQMENQRAKGQVRY